VVKPPQTTVEGGWCGSATPKRSFQTTISFILFILFFSSFFFLFCFLYDVLGVFVLLKKIYNHFCLFAGLGDWTLIFF